MFVVLLLMLGWVNTEPRPGIDFHPGEDEDPNKPKTPCTANVPVSDDGCVDRVCADGFLSGALVERVSYGCCKQVDYSIDCYDEFPELFPDYFDGDGDDDGTEEEADNAKMGLQECKSYRPYPDGTRRRWDYRLGKGEAVVPDYFLGKTSNIWYGAVGVTLWTQPPGLDYCGGVFPVWMRGIPPATGESGSVEVCTQTQNSDCSQTWRVMATNCVTHTIYRLVKTPVQDSVYCTGPDKPGPIINVTTQKPTITIDVVRLQQTSHVLLYCDLDNIDPSYFYQTLWYVNNSRLHMFDALQPTSDYRNATALTEDMLVEKGITNMGFTVRCDIRVKKTKHGPTLTTTGSDWKLAGIKPATWNITLSESEMRVLHLDVTAPVDCGASGQCGLQVLVQSEETPTCGPPAFVEGGCHAWLTAEEGGDLRIRGGQLHGVGTRQGLTRFTLRTGPSHHMAFWRSVTIGDITVMVIKNQTITDRKKCMVGAHPHIVTFDGRHVEHQSPGVFTLYSNWPVNTEVQAQFRKCRDNDAAYCTCALAVRAGQTVFRVDGCGGGPWEIRHVSCDRQGELVSVKRKGSMYIILLPTGTLLHVSIHHHLLSVWLFPARSDILNSKGLCGVLSDSCTDDLQLKDGTYDPSPEATVGCDKSDKWKSFPAFTDSWRVSKTDNLFLDNNLGHLQPWGNTSYPHCHCTSTGTSHYTPACIAATSSFCGNGRRWMEQFTAVVEPEQCSVFDRKQDSTVTLTSEGQQIANGQARIQKTPLNKSEAIEICETVFSRSLKEACSVLPGSGIQTSMDICVLDLQYTNTTDIAVLSVETAKITCIYDLVMGTVDGQRLVEERKAYEDIMAVTCPFDCNGRGVCKNGSCTCNGNYGGYDCSVLRTSPPRTFGLGNGGFCDVRNGTCDKASVLAENVIDSAATMCRIQHFTVDLQGLEVTVDTDFVRGQVASVSEVVCHLSTKSRTQSTSSPSVTGYRVAVSNDGLTFSVDSVLVVYNSECQVCGVDSDSVSCTFTTPSCVADGVCVSQGELHPGNNCYICDVKHPGYWTRHANGTCGGSSEDVFAEWITAGSVTMVTVVFAATCIVLCIKLGKKRIGKSLASSATSN